MAAATAGSTMLRTGDISDNRGSTAAKSSFSTSLVAIVVPVVVVEAAAGIMKTFHLRFLVVASTTHRRRRCRSGCHLCRRHDRAGGGGAPTRSCGFGNPCRSNARFTISRERLVPVRPSPSRSVPPPRPGGPSSSMMMRGLTRRCHGPQYYHYY